MASDVAARVQMVCDKCGSTDVSRDAWSDWDVEAQEWILRAVFDHAHCHGCDRDAQIAEIQLRN